ncbi:unnamed protein product [Haemonchus placei]|uniref:Palmitoyltransferase n=1 Tax=Haemonchus placei TaxID=6290 RepID=A0A0N4WPT9_HAEPC|nr:unnamed protein product [Haemonchus placei]
MAFRLSEYNRICGANSRRILQNSIITLNTIHDLLRIRYCAKCKCIKPDRAHHCSICGQCVLKFDHHCPWVNNCVNFYNYKFFLLFLGYGFVFCIFVFFTDLPYFIQFWTRDYHERNLKTSKIHILFLVFVSGMFAISLSFLFFYHLYLTARNRTTVESFRAPMLEGGPDKRAFDHGIRANYREVFGYDRKLWLLPIFSRIFASAHLHPSLSITLFFRDLMC